MPVKPPGLLTIGRHRYYTPAPGGSDEYYRGSMPEYVAPNQDRLATQPNDQMLYSDAKREGLPIERINDVTDSGIPAPRYTSPALEDDVMPPNFHILKGAAPRKSNEPSQDEIDATARLNQLQYEEYRRQMRGK